LTNINLTGATLDPEAIVTASDWQNAILSDIDRKAAETAEFLTTPIYELDLSSRVHNILRFANIITIKTLISKTSADLLSISGFGRQSLKEVKNALARYNLHLNSETASNRELRHHADMIQTRFRFVSPSTKQLA
jgi:DNA-directed RNA polymerase alpha subunit